MTKAIQAFYILNETDQSNSRNTLLCFVFYLERMTIITPLKIVVLFNNVLWHCIDRTVIASSTPEVPLAIAQKNVRKYTNRGTFSFDFQNWRSGNFKASPRFNKLSVRVDPYPLPICSLSPCTQKETGNYLLMSTSVKRSALRQCTTLRVSSTGRTRGTRNL